MGFKATYRKHRLHFRFSAGTSRGVLTDKDTYYIKIFHSANPTVVGLGECSPLQGLSTDDLPDYEIHLNEIVEQLTEVNLHPYAWRMEDLVHELVGNQFPSIQFGMETALLDWLGGGKRIVFPGMFSSGQQAIPVNGLIWMGDEAFMKKQIDEKIAQGFTCLKLKIGAIDFDRECALLHSIRQRFPAEQITLRVDANGAFAPYEALAKLRVLSTFALHSIEQPIQQGQTDAMAELCQETPVSIALDEELIGTVEIAQKRALLKHISPQFIILKPSLLGGFRHCTEWINLAEERQIGWWITSALESNIGLNAISQFAASLKNPLPQGLGTGQLYTNNIESPLEINHGFLRYNPEKTWEVGKIG